MSDAVVLASASSSSSAAANEERGGQGGGGDDGLAREAKTRKKKNSCTTSLLVGASSVGFEKPRGHGQNDKSTEYKQVSACEKVRTGKTRRGGLDLNQPALGRACAGGGGGGDGRGNWLLLPLDYLATGALCARWLVKVGDSVGYSGLGKVLGTCSLLKVK